MKNREKLQGLTMAGLAATGLGTAQAAIIYHDVDDVTVTYGGAVQSVHVDITAGATTVDASDFKLTFGYDSPRAKLASSGSNTVAVDSSSSTLNLYLENDPIGSLESFNGTGYIGDAGPWSGGATGYAGFSLAGNRYGWMRLTHDPIANSTTIHDFAYEDVAGISIDAGAIPEPATLGLGLLFGSGIFCIRRFFLV